MLRTPSPVASRTQSRRTFLSQALAATAGVASLSLPRLLAEETEQPVIRHGQIRQSIMGWCFNPMPTLELAKHCKAIGLEAMEGIPTTFYPQVKELGLKISLVPSHGFAQGPVSRENHEVCRQKLLASIDLAAEIGTKNVITFTGMSEAGISPEQGTKNCVELWQSVMKHAESKGICLVLEHLNSRDDSHPMKGHPGYFGDDVDFCVDLIKRVDSPNMKLLFDIYHVQVMNGDLIRRINQYQDVIGHYHTAGNPGRGELDLDQEINYPGVLRAILKTGYKGYVAQEFIPTWEDPIAALRHAARLCDVTI